MNPSANIAFVPLAMPSTAGPGTIAMIISSASTVRQSSTFADWVLMVAPPLIFFLVAVDFVGEAYAAPAQLCGWWARVALKRSPV